MRQPDDIRRAQAGLRLSIGALLDDYPQAVKDGRTDVWLKAVLAVAEWYAHIESNGLDGEPRAAPTI